MTLVPAHGVTRTFSLARTSGKKPEQHAPNEHLPPAVLREALSVMTGLYWDLGAGNTPKNPS